MTSSPASRRARETTLTPRSWPSSPALAIKIRALPAAGGALAVLDEGWLTIASQHDLHCVRDLLDGSVGAHCFEDVLHHVLVALGSALELFQATLNAAVVARLFQLSDASDLLLLHIGINF